jgi:L-threonylcarbamoyladenylate synthase
MDEEVFATADERPSMTELVDPTPTNLDRVAECVREGGVVVAPSDTNLGLLLQPTSPAVERAYEIKGRDPEKPLTLFVRDPDDWRRYGRHDDPALVEAVTDAFWPGPLNVVLEATDGVDHERLRMDGTVSIGCLSNSVWRDLTSRLEGPLAMTSANQSGAMTDDELVGVDTALEQVGDAVDYVLDAEPEGTTRASTILSLAGDPRILRAGDLSRAEIAARTPVW